MKIPAIILVIGLALTGSAAAEGASNSKSAPGASSKGELAEIRSLVHELTGHTEKLRDLLDQYASLVEQKPAGGAQLEKWEAALDRLLKRVEAQHKLVVDAKQRLEQKATGELPTGLAKDVARARNEADAERANAETALAKNKSKGAKKPAKPAKEAPPPLPDDLDL
jgi:hypothetical protein